VKYILKNRGATLYIVKIQIIYDVVYAVDIASATSGGNEFFVELAAEAAKTYKVALIAGKTTPDARRLLAGVDPYDGGIYGDCELPHTCPLKAAKFLIYATKVLNSIKFRLLHTNAHPPNHLNLYPRRTIATIHHLKPASLHPLARLIQILELKAPKLALHAPHKIALNAVVAPPILRHAPPQIQHMPRQRVLVVMIGRLEPRKNHHLALAAFKIA